ncbi:MAG: ShlB/FhaC/HecB family hemolysin secretion/activation protein [Sedimentisphaerales bacterium]|nr:ShlB/FhaC/HecB family hemolysin secretion/activation protein [Sedimentisphaerales bacterium]
MNDLPGLKVTSVIRPASGVPGAAVLVLKVREKRLSVAAELNNRGSRFVGPHHLSLSGQAEGYFGWDERLSARMLAASQTDEMRYASLTYEQTFGSEGLTGYVSGAYSTQEPGFTLNQLDVDSHSRILAFGVEYPLLRSRNKNLRLGLDFDVRNSRSEMANVLFSRDRIRSLRLHATYDFLDTLGGINVFQTELSQGLPIFGASDEDSPTLSRANGNVDYTKINAYLSRNQHLVDEWSLFAAVMGQYAFATLLSSEEFAFGGAHFGSAYDASEITGDHGAAIRTEVRWSWTGEPVTWGQLYGFHDYGCVWRRESTRESQLDAASAGFGIRLRAGDNLSAAAEIAKPLTRKVGAEDDRDVRAFFSVMYQY